MAPLRSGLPEDRGYWDGLAGRIIGDAEPVLAEYAQRASWWATLARRAPALAAAAAIALVAGSLVLREAPDRATRSPGQQLALAIGPTDPLARMVLIEETAPRVESLMPVMANTGSDR